MEQVGLVSPDVLSIARRRVKSPCHHHSFTRPHHVRRPRLPLRRRALCRALCRAREEAAPAGLGMRAVPVTQGPLRPQPAVHHVQEVPKPGVHLCARADAQDEEGPKVSLVGLVAGSLRFGHLGSIETGLGAAHPPGSLTSLLVNSHSRLSRLSGCS